MLSLALPEEQKISVVYITSVDKTQFFAKIFFFSVYLPLGCSICDSCQSYWANQRLIHSALSCENNSYMQGWLISCKMPSHATSPDPDFPYLKVFYFSGCEIFPDHRITEYYIHTPFEGPEISASSSFAILTENKKSTTVATWRKRRGNLSWFAENLRF